MSTAAATTLESIVEALSGVVGNENVISDVETLNKYSSDTICQIYGNNALYGLKQASNRLIYPAPSPGEITL